MTPAELIALFNVDFGKAPVRPKAAPAPAKKAPPPSLEERIRQVVTGKSSWEPISRVAHLVVQRCKCCGHTSEYVGNVLIRHRSRVTRDTYWDAAIPMCPSHAKLPQLVISHDMDVERCASCIRVELSVCAFPPAFPHQQSLFDQEPHYEQLALESRTRQTAEAGQADRNNNSLNGRALSEAAITLP